MTDIELKTLKDNLWHSADMLRAGAHLAANKYGQPILGLIFLRYADILFKQHKEEIDKEYEKCKGTRLEKAYKVVAIEKCGFFGCDTRDREMIGFYKVLECLLVKQMGIIQCERCLTVQQFIQNHSRVCYFSLLQVRK